MFLFCYLSSLYYSSYLLLITCISLISLIHIVKGSREKYREVQRSIEKYRESTNKISIHPLTSFAEDIGLTKLGSASCCIRTTARLNTVVIAVSQVCQSVIFNDLYNFLYQCGYFPPYKDVIAHSLVIPFDQGSCILLQLLLSPL